jgi:hypothetical protein
MAETERRPRAGRDRAAENRPTKDATATGDQPENGTGGAAAVQARDATAAADQPGNGPGNGTGEGAAPLVPRLSSLAALLISSFLVVAAILAQFTPHARNRALEDLSP